MAYPIKSKGSSMADSYWRKILDLENLMNLSYTRKQSCRINLKRNLLDHYKLKLCIPTAKLHLESLGKLGDSFLEYDVSIQLFKTYESHHEGFLKIKKKSFPMLHCASAYLNLCGEVAPLPFMKWLWLHIDVIYAPMPRHFPVNAEKLVNVWYFESLLHYKFNYPSVLVEALTQGSYMLLEISR
ncbi:hypothetical protein H5410_000871 [Solanum commersonii]|uniref:Uncharacterized protein n=1 Tax=Solanum commersonii TaxID=4109 RepID=A0A9J6AXZ5_SOLCO|nr:hypothetical protein H5410_000871 [Solanum commersonii]